MIYNILFIAGFLLLPFLTGVLLDRFLPFKNKEFESLWVYGLLLLITIFECISVVLIMKEGTLEMLMWSYTAVIMLLSCTGLGLLIKKREYTKRYHNDFLREPAFYIFILLLILVGIVVSFSETDISGDINLEIVKTTLDSGTLFTINPLTGEKFDVGMTPLSKLQTLPLFLAVVAKQFELDPVRMEEIWVPLALFASVIFLAGNYGMFLKEKLNLKIEGKNWWFLNFSLCLLLFGNFGNLEAISFFWNESQTGMTWMAMILIPLFTLSILDQDKSGTIIEKVMKNIILAGMLSVCSLFLLGGNKESFLFITLNLVVLLVKIVFSILVGREEKKNELSN